MADRPLAVWLHGIHVADITTRGPGQVTCRYTPDALDRWPGGAPVLSCSLPLGARPLKEAGTWFRGLLPEGNALQAMAAAARVPTYDTFGMVARFGRDVAGAVIVTDADAAPRAGDIVPYTEESLAAEVGDLEDRPLALHDDSELSLPGLQNKLLLVATDDGWARPIGGRPSTHILKTEDRRYPGLVTQEAAALRLARAVDLTTIEAEVVTFDDVDCIVVSRYDRHTDLDGTVSRIHQEDVCQALGIDIDANRGRAKYQADGGPSFAQVALLLDRYASDPIVELTRLVRILTFTVAIGDSDAHGKNLSLLHDTDAQVRLAPLYDVVPTVLWPRLPDRAAMHVNGRTKLSDVTFDDIVAEGTAWPLDAGLVSDTVTTTAQSLLANLGEATGELATQVERRCVELLDER